MLKYAIKECLRFFSKRSPLISILSQLFMFKRNGYKVKIVRICSFKDYCSKLGDNNFLPIHEDEVSIVYPVNFVGKSKKAPFPCKMHENYIAKLENAVVIGSSNAVLVNNQRIVLYDLALNKKYRITDPGFIMIENHENKNASEPAIFWGEWIAKYKGCSEKVDEAICILGNYSWNFYHYIYEFISKFYLLEKMDIDASVPILVDSIVNEIPQYRELLNLFRHNRNIVYVNHLESVEVKKLYYPSFVNHIPPNFKSVKDIVSDSVYFDTAALKYMRESFLNYSYGNSSSYPKLLYLSRKSTKNRKYNEMELVTIAKTFGFSDVCPEEYTIKEQFVLFSHADFIIAASGAALSNIICCKPGCKILVLTSSDFNLTIFSSIAGLVGAEMVYMCGLSNDPSDIQAGFSIDKDMFSDFLNRQLISKD